ncbi:LOW QUALITY PROTEIN: immunoglobulin superfamily DCC subclass member 3-like [Erethizon dorsatum]
MAKPQERTQEDGTAAFRGPETEHIGGTGLRAAGLSRFHHPESLEVEWGGVARFQCLIRVPEPSISWEHNGSALTTDHRVMLLPGSTLHITSVSQADEGTYHCVAHNVASTHHSQDTQLTLSRGPPRLQQEPEILSGPQNLTLTVHQTAVLEGVVTGLPRPLVSWSRRERSHPPGPRPGPGLARSVPGPSRCPADGRSIGVEGIQVLGTGNIMIDVSLQRSGVYVCAANRPGTSVRSTAPGPLLVQAAPEFVQWPQSWFKPVGSSAIFTCVAQGVPEPRMAWLKNGKLLTPGDIVRLTRLGKGLPTAVFGFSSTLMLLEVSMEGEAIYQCVAENSVGSNQASACLALTGGPAPGASGPELPGAVSRGNLEHVFSNLEPAPAYMICLRAYSIEGTSQDSASILTSTLGSAPGTLGFSTKVLNATSVSSWELLSQVGAIQAFELFHHRLPAAHLEGLLLLACNVSSFLYADPVCATRQAGCSCGQGESSSLPGLVVGIHVGLSALMVCLFCLFLGWRHRLFAGGGPKKAGQCLSLPWPQLGTRPRVEKEKMEPCAQPGLAPHPAPSPGFTSQEPQEWEYSAQAVGKLGP